MSVWRGRVTATCTRSRRPSLSTSLSVSTHKSWRIQKSGSSKRFTICASPSLKTGTAFSGLPEFAKASKPATPEKQMICKRQRLLRILNMRRRISFFLTVKEPSTDPAYPRSQPTPFPLIQLDKKKENLS